MVKLLPEGILVTAISVLIVLLFASPSWGECYPLTQIGAINNQSSDFFEQGREQFEIEIQHLQAGTLPVDEDLLQINPRVYQDQPVGDLEPSNPPIPEDMTPHPTEE